MIIDGLPHEIEPQKYDKNKYEEFYAEVISNSNLGFKAKESYYGDIMVDCEFQIQLAVEDNLIIGSKAFKTILIENFFKDKITRKICDKSIFSNVDDENQEFYYCSKDLNLSEFKNITLSIDNSQLKIELNYNDLFYEYKDHYYFMIYFPSQTYSYYFILGKALFQKYTLTFTHDTKMIGYYKEDNNNKKENEDEDENENENNKENKRSDGKKTKEDYHLIPWIIIGVLVFIILVLGFYIFYYRPCKSRTKRANELQDDNYSYNEINNNE